MGKGKRVAVRRSAKEWRAILSRFERSGQRCEQSCTAESLALSTFSLWRCKLGWSGSAGEANSAAALVELPAGPSSVPGWEAELDLGDRVVLRWRRPSRC